MSMEDVVIFKGRRLFVEYVLMPTTESANNDPGWEVDVELTPENCVIEISEVRDELDNVLDHKSPEFQGLSEIVKKLYFSSEE